MNKTIIAVIAFMILLTEAVNADSYPNNVNDSDNTINNNSKITESEPNSASDYCKQGGIFFNKDEYDSAIENFNKAIELDSKNSDAYYSRGASWYRKGDIVKAFNDYKRAFELNSKYSGVYYPWNGAISNQEGVYINGPPTNQNMKCWEPFNINKIALISYRYTRSTTDDNSLILYMDQERDSLGYRYFYIRFDPITHGSMDEISKEVDKKYPREFKNVKLGYCMAKCRIDGKTSKIEYVHDYFFSNSNNLIVDYDTKTTPQTLKGSLFEKLPFNKDELQQAKKEAIVRDRELALLKKYNVKEEVSLEQLEANPYEFEGKAILVRAAFKRMISPTTAIFSRGYTNTFEQIVVTGIPKGMHFNVGSWGPNVKLIIRGRGAREFTNAFGATIDAPYFQFLAVVPNR